MQIPPDLALQQRKRHKHFNKHNVLFSFVLAFSMQLKVHE
jgi:hypothetical protein